MTPLGSASSHLFFCRWDYCTRGFPSVSELQRHFEFDHIPQEKAVYIPAHKRRRRDDGAWVLVEDSYRLSDELVIPRLSQTTGDVTTTTTGMTGASSSAADSSGLHSHSLPSYPHAHSHRRNSSSAAAAMLPPDSAPAATVDYSAFLRSPSPTSPGVPMQSTPFSQIPLPTQSQSQSLDADKEKQKDNQAQAQSQSDSSGAITSDSSGPFLTQAPYVHTYMHSLSLSPAIPPPSQPQAGQSVSHFPAVPVFPGVPGAIPVVPVTPVPGIPSTPQASASASTSQQSDPNAEPPSPAERIRSISFGARARSVSGQGNTSGTVPSPRDVGFSWGSGK